MENYSEKEEIINYKNKTITILICCYNAEKFLKECLDSLVNQSVSSLFFNTLFINDASTDKSLEIAKSYSTFLNNFTLIDYKKHEGLTRSCNKALKMISTPYFMRFDSDDFLTSNAVEKMLKELNSSKNKDFIVFKRWDTWNTHLKKIEISDDVYKWIATGTVFRTQSVKNVGGYCNEYWEEYDLYIRLLEAGYKHKISPYRIYYYRRGHGSSTQQYEENKIGFDSLINKWGLKTLEKYGEFTKGIEYYSKGG